MLKKLEIEEKTLQFEKFDNDDALKLGLWYVDYAKKNNFSIGIKIERNRQVIFSYMMNGTCIENEKWYDRKKNVVDRYSHSSKYVKVMYEQNDKNFSNDSLLDKEFYQAEGGSFPLIIKNTGVIGSITICGLSGDEDHDICVKGIKNFLEVN